MREREGRGLIAGNIADEADKGDGETKVEEVANRANVEGEVAGAGDEGRGEGRNARREGDLLPVVSIALVNGQITADSEGRRMNQRGQRKKGHRRGEVGKVHEEGRRG